MMHCHFCGYEFPNVWLLSQWAHPLGCRRYKWLVTMRERRRRFMRQRWAA